jgi:signal transduction histidine kinase
VETVVDYVKRRASGKIRFQLNVPAGETLVVPLSPTLFDWVIENLLKNALDAMEGIGQITVDIKSLDKIKQVLHSPYFIVDQEGYFAFISNRKLPDGSLKELP